VKKNPGKYSYASSGTGSPHHIFMELLKKQLGLDMVHVPYKGSSGAMVDLLSGKVDMAFLRRHAGHRQPAGRQAVHRRHCRWPSARC
jgi:tripartite-type tricarboxylate transporter receptor subunit TctC